MKKNTSNTKANVSTKETKVDKINLSKFADQLSKIDVKEKRKKETLYIYPEDMHEADINGEKGKKFRNSLRNQMKRFANNIFAFAKIQEVEKLQKEIAAFNEFYKKNYRLNDFSLNSITNTKNESKERDLDLMLSIIKESMK